MTATKIEKRIISFLEKHIYLLIIIVVSIGAILIRILLKDRFSDDFTEYLLPWYEQLDSTKFSGLSQQVGDYNILYQTIIVLLTFLPIKALYAYKLVSIIFDFLLAILAARIFYKNAKKNNKIISAFVYAGILLSPLVFLNSSYWAQCDSIYTFFCIFSLYLLFKEHYAKSFVLLGFAFVFKLQAVFILPVFIFLYLYQKRFSIIYFLIVPLTMIVMSIPGLLCGRKIWDIFSIYFSQAATSSQMAANYPSFWLLLRNNNLESYFHQFFKVAIILTVVILALYMVFWLKKSVKISLANILILAFIVSYTCVLFLPGMHERYGYICEILALFLAFYFIKTIPMLGVMYGLSIITYGNFLFHNKTPVDILAIVNVLLYIVYVLYFSRILLADGSSKNK